MRAPGTFTFDGPAGRIEAIYGGVEHASRAGVVCHPLPTHGGTMHDKVVYRTAKAMEAHGYATLRFNFRGTGCSDGEFTGGEGEADDVRAALDWIAHEHPAAPIVVAGFSFGNVVGLPVGAEDPRVDRLIGLGTPTDRYDFDALAEVEKPKLFVQGDRDEHGPLAELRAGLDRVAEPKRLVVVEGADHFFTDRLRALQRAVGGWLEELDRA